MLSNPKKLMSKNSMNFNLVTLSKNSCSRNDLSQSSKTQISAYNNKLKKQGTLLVSDSESEMPAFQKQRRTLRGNDFLQSNLKLHREQSSPQTQHTTTVNQAVHQCKMIRSKINQHRREIPKRLVKNIKRVQGQTNPQYDSMFKKIQEALEHQQNNEKIIPDFYSPKYRTPHHNKLFPAPCEEFKKSTTYADCKDHHLQIVEILDDLNSSNMITTDRSMKRAPEEDVRLRNMQLEKLLRKEFKDIFIFPHQKVISDEVVQPHIVLQPVHRPKKLPLTAKEKQERSKLEHILKSPSFEFFPIINDILTGRIEPPVMASRSTKLIKRMFSKQMESNQLNFLKPYTSLYGESNPDKYEADGLDFSYLHVKHDESGVRRAVMSGTDGGSTLNVRALERIMKKLKSIKEPKTKVSLAMHNMFNKKLTNEMQNNLTLTVIRDMENKKATHNVLESNFKCDQDFISVPSKSKLFRKQIAQMEGREDEENERLNTLERIVDFVIKCDAKK